VNTLRFSCWAKWDGRLTLAGLNYPGIYALVISKSDISGQDYSWMEDIAYFGMTNSKRGLKGRLSQFNNSLRDKKRGRLWRSGALPP
jgi:hypothetical protein